MAANTVVTKYWKSTFKKKNFKNNNQTVVTSRPKFSFLYLLKSPVRARKSNDSICNGFNHSKCNKISSAAFHKFNPCQKLVAFLGERTHTTIEHPTKRYPKGRNAIYCSLRKSYPFPRHIQLKGGQILLGTCSWSRILFGERLIFPRIKTKLRLTWVWFLISIPRGDQISFRKKNEYGARYKKQTSFDTWDASPLWRTRWLRVKHFRELFTPRKQKLNLEARIPFCVEMKVYREQTTHLFACLILQLPPPPQIELVVDKPHLMGVLRRPIVRIRRKCLFCLENPQISLILNPSSSSSSSSTLPSGNHHH